MCVTPDQQLITLESLFLTLCEAKSRAQATTVNRSPCPTLPWRFSNAPRWTQCLGGRRCLPVLRMRTTLYKASIWLAARASGIFPVMSLGRRGLCITKRYDGYQPTAAWLIECALGSQANGQGETASPVFGTQHLEESALRNGNYGGLCE